MILPFSTTVNKKPSYFVEKIWKALKDQEITQELADATFNNFFDWDIYGKVAPKLHTVRADTKNRWKVGNNIHFYINCRQKNMFQFAPVLKVKNIQEITITKLNNTGIWYKDFVILIDNVYLKRNQIEAFAINDGFDTAQDLFNYFYPAIEHNSKKQFKGKIIHWTDMKYNIEH